MRLFVVSLRIFPGEGVALQLCLLNLPNPDLVSLLAGRMQEENHPVPEAVVYRLCEHPCGLGSASSVCVIINSSVHTNIYFPLLE